MKLQALIFSVLFFLGSWHFAFSVEDKKKSHSHSGKEVPAEEGAEENHDDHHDHEEEGKGDEDHAKHGEHGDEGDHKKNGDHKEEEGGKNVGPTKGIISFSESKGFVLSPEAYKNFEIEKKTLEGAGPWTLPKSALLQTGDEKSVYRIRDGAFKRVDIQLKSKTKDSITFQSIKIKTGDEVAVKGAGFLRIAEVDLTSGETGHHH